MSGQLTTEVWHVPGGGELRFAVKADELARVTLLKVPCV